MHFITEYLPSGDSHLGAALTGLSFWLPGCWQFFASVLSSSAASVAGPSQSLAHFKLLTQKLILASGCCQASRSRSSSYWLLVPGSWLLAAGSWLLLLSGFLPSSVHLVAFHSFADCNISLPLRFVCCILSSVAEVCLN